MIMIKQKLPHYTTVQAAKAVKDIKEKRQPENAWNLKAILGVVKPVAPQLRSHFLEL